MKVVNNVKAREIVTITLKIKLTLGLTLHRTQNTIFEL